MAEMEGPTSSGGLTRPPDWSKDEDGRSDSDNKLRFVHWKSIKSRRFTPLRRPKMVSESFLQLINIRKVHL